MARWEWLTATVVIGRNSMVMMAIILIAVFCSWLIWVSCSALVL